MIEEIYLDYDPNKQEELAKLAQDSRDIKEIYLDLTKIIHEQDQEFNYIEKKLDNTYVEILKTNKNISITEKLVKKNILLKSVAVVGLGIAGSLSGGLLGGYLLGHTIIGGAIGLFSGTGIFSSAAILINS